MTDERLVEVMVDAAVKRLHTGTRFDHIFREAKAQDMRAALSALREAGYDPADSERLSWMEQNASRINRYADTDIRIEWIGDDGHEQETRAHTSLRDAIDDAQEVNRG